ncbi:MAG TPA: hypothetical protein PKO15_11555 [Fibrobacteria bacterium]|nr:hypothetical protein [Fibrobacteria bacterium]
MNSSGKVQSGGFEVITASSTKFFLFLCFAWICDSFAVGPNLTSSKLNVLGLQAIDSGEMVMRNDSVYLFGVLTNGADTKKGQWACAKVASIVLQKSGSMKHVVLGVSQIESSLKNWKRIDREDSLIPGDVVIWTRRYKAGKDGNCVGSGTCHIGIVTTKGYFHNDPLLKRPSMDGLSLLAFKFKYGLRPK